MEGWRTFAIRFKRTNSGEGRFFVQQSRLLKYFCFSLLFFPFVFSSPHFQRYTNENAKHGAERRVSTIFNWPCTSMPRRYIFRSARLETAVCAHQRPRPDRNFIALRETVGRPFAKKFTHLPPNYFGNRSDKLKLEGRERKSNEKIISPTIAIPDSRPYIENKP